MEALDTIRNQIEAFKPQYRSTALSDIRPVSPNVVEVNNRPINMTGNAVKGLCKLLKMPQGFYSRLYSDDKSEGKRAWNTVIKTLADQREKKITLIAENNTIIGAVSTIQKVTPHHKVLELAEWAMRRRPALAVTPFGSRFDGMNLSIQLVYRNMNINTGQWRNVMDTFRQGWTFENYFDGRGFYGSTMLYRVPCDNLSTVVRVGGTRQIRDFGEAPDFMFGADSPDLADLIKSAAVRMRDSQASVREVLDVTRTIEPWNKGEVDLFPLNPLRVDDIAGYYHKTVEGLKEMPSTWQRTAKTPINLYDLFNFVTRNATHREAPVEASAALRQIGGDMLLAAPDLMSWAPDVKFDGEWNVSPN